MDNERAGRGIAGGVNVNGAASAGVGGGNSDGDGSGNGRGAAAVVVGRGSGGGDGSGSTVGAANVDARGGGGSSGGGGGGRDANSRHAGATREEAEWARFTASIHNIDRHFIIAAPKAGGTGSVVCLLCADTQHKDTKSVYHGEYFLSIVQLYAVVPVLACLPRNAVGASLLSGYVLIMPHLLTLLCSRRIQSTSA